MLGGCTSLAQLLDSAPPGNRRGRGTPSIHPSQLAIELFDYWRVCYDTHGIIQNTTSHIRVNCSSSLRIIEFYRAYKNNIFANLS